MHDAVRAGQYSDIYLHEVLDIKRIMTVSLKQELLLKVQHTKLDNNPSYWQLFGGGI